MFLFPSTPVTVSKRWSQALRNGFTNHHHELLLLVMVLFSQAGSFWSAPRREGIGVESFANQNS